MAISKSIQWLLTYMTLQYGCSAYDIDREVCLHTPFAFALGKDRCWFTLQVARKWLESETDTMNCSQKCHIKMNSLKSKVRSYNGYTYYEPKYQLKSLVLGFNGLSETLTMINTGCSYLIEEKTLEINVDISKDLCTLTKACEEESKTCSASLAGQIGICICKPGYIGFGNECLNGNLKLNETCKYNEQCSMVFGSVCQNNTCVCSRGYVPLNDSECVLSDISKDLCTLTTDCEDVSKTCWLTGQIGVCICKPEYIGFGNKCLKGNLKLNEPCKRNEQCSVAIGSVCQNDTCVCRPGYAPLNDSECVLWQSGGNSQASIQDKKEDNVVGFTVGSVFGGLILGIILTVLAATIHHHVRHGKPKTKERECSKVAFFNNTTCETDKDAPQNIPDVHRTHEKKVLNVQPFANSVEMPMSRNAQGVTKRSMASNDVNDDVYNHLHEKEEDAEVDEHYDHAHDNPSHAMGESNYSILNTGRRNREPEVSAYEDNDYDVQKSASDY